MHLGIDFGTTGARACVVNEDGSIAHQDRVEYTEPEKQSPLEWREAMLTLLHRLPASIASRLRGIAIDGTSATVLLCDAELEPHSLALLYNDSRAIAEAHELKKIAPPGHIVGSATSGLAKFLWLTRHSHAADAVHFLHQADWLAALLTGLGGISDYHNALKTGYDAENMCWPDWVQALSLAHLLPQVVAPGTAIAQIQPEISQHFKINPACVVHAGTTDSIAAFMAAGISEPGVAVSSLGTTLVLKQLSERAVESAQYGVYSHRYGKLWLAGGASNAGGGVLRHFFSNDRLTELSERIDPDIDTSLDYYPMLQTGERFPINDPQLNPRLDPRPMDDAEFLHGLLQGLSHIEASGYAKLAELGATPLKAIHTVGGGARNTVWLKMRSRLIGVPIVIAQNTEAAYGAALLSQYGLPD